jgi:hypothetical protein
MWTLTSARPEAEFLAGAINIVVFQVEHSGYVQLDLFVESRIAIPHIARRTDMIRTGISAWKQWVCLDAAYHLLSKGYF